MPQHRSRTGGATAYVITHQGVPVGTVASLPAEGDRFTLEVFPLPAYTTIEPFVREASCALADVAVGRPANPVALSRAAALGRALELRDPTGTLVAVDFIELTDWPGGRPPVAAFIRRGEAHAPVPAVVPPRPREDSSGSAPAP